MTMQTNTYLISVRPIGHLPFSWPQPQDDRTQKRQLWSLSKTGDRIAIYATLPTAEVLGIVRVLKRESLSIDRLWRESEQGKLAKVSRVQFDAYYSNQN
jgi:hypothetical protein